MQDLDFIRQQNEAFLVDLEALAVQALASRDWEAVYAHIAKGSTDKISLSDHFRSEQDFVSAIAFINRVLGEASTKDLPRPGAGSFPQTAE